MTYDSLLVAADSLGLVTREKDLQAYDGRIKGTRVAIRHTIPTYRKKACVLAEELGHYFTSSGDILDDTPKSRKQERKARMWAYDLQVGLHGLIEAKEAGCKTIYEIAEYLDVPISFLNDCLKCYRDKYGTHIKYCDFVIFFDPYMQILTLQEAMKLQNDW